MKKMTFGKRLLALAVVFSPLMALFVYVALRSGPLAPVAVVLAPVELKALSPAIFGIGTVEARHIYKMGPTLAGRVKSLDVQVGDRVQAGQRLGEMEAVDLDERLKAQDAAIKQAQAKVNEAQTYKDHAQTQASRYDKLLKDHSTSEEVASAKRQDLSMAQARLAAAREELARARAEREALEAQRNHLALVAPVNGLVVRRDADPGTTVVAGQAVVELIDPDTLWVDVRFDQIRSGGLDAGLPAQITLRSRAENPQTGHVLRVDPLADPVTEETMAKVVFDRLPDPRPPVGELVEVTVALPAVAAAPVIPQAALHRVEGRWGVWRVVSDDLQFVPVSPGIADLEGLMQVREGLEEGDQVVVYSESALTPHRSIRIVDHIKGVTR